MTPLLTRIDQELATCTDPSRRGELLAERACYLARIGQTDRARALIDHLRSQFGDGSVARVSILVLIAEGLVLYFEDFNPLARDRMLRASVLAQAIEAKDIASLAFAWLAHIEFNRLSFLDMARAIRRCTRYADCMSVAAKARLFLVLADSNLYAGRAQVARRYYELARLAAVDVGDEATIAAMLYNRAALTLDLIRIGEALGTVDPEWATFLELHVDSACNFHAATNDRSLPQLLAAARGRLLLVKGEFRTAADILEPLVSSPLAFAADAASLLLKLEYCLCLVETGSNSEATALFEQFELEPMPPLSSDEDLMLTYLSIRIASRLKRPVSHGFRLQHLEHLRSVHLSEMQSLCQLLDEFVDFVSE